MLMAGERLMSVACIKETFGDLEAIGECRRAGSDKWNIWNHVWNRWRVRTSRAFSKHCEISVQAVAGRRTWTVLCAEEVDCQIEICREHISVAGIFPDRVASPQCRLRRRL